MAHKFHDINGLLLVGIDAHDGVHWPTPIPAPMLFWELNLLHPFWMGGNQKPTVKMNGVNSVVDAHSPKILWPHFPFSPDPLNLTFPLDLVFGEQSCWLPRGQVLICGTPAAPTVFPCSLSLNLDCWMVGKIPTSLIFQPGTVETTPTWDDYKAGLIRAAVNLAVSALFYFLTRGKTKMNTRTGWGNLMSGNMRQFFNSTGWKKAGNRLAREFVGRITPLKWNTKSQSFNLKSPASIMNMVRNATGFNAGAAATGQNPWPSSLGDGLKGAIPGVKNVLGAVDGITASH